jgi:hypothetical protein
MITPTSTFTFEPWFATTWCDPENLRMAWRDACTDVRVAYHTWREGPTGGRADAFTAYVAAADREAAAAGALARRAVAAPAVS